jgi:trimeric autotransporter adhesin
MKKTIYAFRVAVVCTFPLTVLLCGLLSQAQQSVATATNVVVPPLVNFNGVLADIDGKPLTGVVGVTFYIYNEQQGSAPLWMETQNVQPDATGHYSVMLGATTSTGLPSSVFATGEAHWLGVQAQGRAEQPRVLLVSVPYALKAIDAETLGGKPASAYALATPQTGTSAPANETPKASAPISASNNKQSSIHPATTGSGTANYVPLWTSSTALGNSNIFENATNKNIGIGTTTPTATLDVKGHGIFTGNNTTQILNVAQNGTGNGITANSKSGPALAGVNNTGGGLFSYGVFGVAEASTGAGVAGFASNASGSTYGVYGQAASTSGMGVEGVATSTVGNGYGVYGTNATQAGAGIEGYAANTTFGRGAQGASAGSSGIGVEGDSGGTGGTGVFGNETATTGTTYGVYGVDASPSGYGVYGTATASGEAGGVGVYGSGGVGVVGVGTGSSGIAPICCGAGGNFVGFTAPTGSGEYGTDGIDAEGGNGDPDADSENCVAFSICNGGFGIIAAGGTGGNEDGAGGVFTGGNSTVAGDGIIVGAGSGFAGSFYGDVGVNGTLYATAKMFKMDDPMDPANKYLVHASVESSEMMNIYTGNVTTDAQGEATVQLPEWFEVLNTDFRYQLTVIGQFAQAIVGRKIENNRFEIRTNVPNVEVSWQVTGVRQDAYAKEHPLVVEQEKDFRLRGFYIHPELYGAPPEKQIEWARHPQLMKRLEEMRGRQLAAAKKQTAPRN